MGHPHHHVARTAVAALATQAVGCLASMQTTGRAAEAFAALGAAAAVAVALLDAAPTSALGRRAAAVLLLTLWSVRLSAYLHARNLPPPVPVRTLAISRTLWSVGAALPVVLLLAVVGAPDAFTRGEAAAAAVAAAALALEARADAEKWRWHTKPDSGPVVTTGTWAYSRHANYAGEALFHVAMWWLCARGAAYPLVSLCSCVVMTWHMALSRSGPLVVSEQTRALVFENDAVYAAYVASTSVIVPLPAALWRSIGPAGRGALLERADWRRGALLPLLAVATSRI